MTTLEGEFMARRQALLKGWEPRQAVWFDAELDKPDKWAEDKRTGFKADLPDIGAEMRVLKRSMRESASLPEKLELRRRASSLDRRRDELWRAYDAAAREIEETRAKLIDGVQARLAQGVDKELLFAARREAM